MKFDKFKGIQKEREITEKKCNLDNLLAVCDKVIQEYKHSLKYVNDARHKIYPQIYRQIKQYEFSEQDLKSLIYAKANNEYSENESYLIGLYTSVLLHILTEKNREKGRGTRFCINGYGNKFDYLFYFAKEIDELCIDSFVGKNICNDIASHGGKANKIILNNNQGNGIALYAGTYGGRIGKLIINNNQGYSAAKGAGCKEGKIGTLIINNSKGGRAAYEAGYSGGNIGTLIINNNKGYDSAHSAGNSRGHIKTAIINSNEGDRTAADAGSDAGKIDTLIIDNSKGKNAAVWAGSYEGSIGTLVINNKGRDTAADAGRKKGRINNIVLVSREIQDSAEAKQIISGEEARQEYQKISQQYKLEEVYALLDSFKNKTPEEMITATEQIEEYLKNVR